MRTELHQLIMTIINTSYRTNCKCSRHCRNVSHKEICPLSLLRDSYVCDKLMVPELRYDTPSDTMNFLSYFFFRNDLEDDA